MGSGTPLENHKNIGFSIARRADDGPLIVVFGSSTPPPHQALKKTLSKLDPPLTKLSGSAHAL